MRDLFFFIWHDELGIGWMLFTIVLFLMSLVTIVIMIAYNKANNKKFTKKHLISLFIILLLIYQIIPEVFHVSSMFTNSVKDAIKREKLAINSAIIPWQKGAYYCSLAFYYLKDKGKYNKDSYLAHKKAYEYIKSYKYPCWGISFMEYYAIGEYDIAIEIAKNFKFADLSRFIAPCYVMKGDFKNALYYIDRDLSKGQSIYSLSLKAYIEKVLAHNQEADKYYKQALSLCKNQSEVNIVNERYNNFEKIEKEKMLKIRKEMELE